MLTALPSSFGRLSPVLTLFGVPTLHVARGPLVFSAERPFQLLALLACRHHWSSRDELAELLWPERDQSLARSNLRKVLQRVRAIAAGSGWEEQGDRLRWRPDSDLSRFDAACAAGDCATALKLHAGLLLQGLEPGLSPAAAEALALERERVRRAWQAAAEVELRAWKAQPDALAKLAESLLAHDPVNESAVAALAEARREQGRPGDALRLLDEHAKRLASKWALQPSAPLLAMRHALQTSGYTEGPAGGRREEPPPATAPAVDQRFVGRRIELQQLRRLLCQVGCRLLSLTGPAGVGKTSLARAALQPLRAHFPQGCLWWPLEDLNDCTEAATRLAEQLGLPLAGAADPWNEIARHFGTGGWLLVADNAEHLPLLPARVAGLLAVCPGLKVLNVSRSRWALDEEWLLPLEGLPLPDVDEVDPEVLLQCDAVRLFDVRAQAAQGGFDLARQAADVVALVHAVDGLPLALELAAPWTRWLPVREIVAELRSSLDLLGSERADAPHERSLRAGFARSWRWLSSAQRRDLVGLALLPSTFDSRMAREVVGCELPGLGALADRSLVSGDGQGRFSLHPLIRRCAAEKAAECGVVPGRLAQRHAGHVLRSLADGFLLSAPGQASRAVAADLAHVRSAWRSAVGHRQWALIDRAAIPVAQLCAGRGLLDEGLQLMSEAMSVLDASAPAAALGRVGLARAQLVFRAGRMEEAQSHAWRAFRLARRARDAQLGVLSLNLIGTAYIDRRRVSDGHRVLTRALALARSAALHREIGILLGGLGRVSRMLGRFDEAGAFMVEALEGARSCQPPNHEGVVLQTNNLGNLLASQGRWSEALRRFEEALQACDAQGVEVHRVLILMNLGRAFEGLGRMDEARHWTAKALSRAREEGRAKLIGELLLLQARLALDSGQRAQACALVGEALASAQRAGLDGTRVNGVAVYGLCLRQIGDVMAAAGFWQWALEQPVLALDEQQVWRQHLSALGLTPARLLEALDRQPVGDRSPAGMALYVSLQCRQLQTGLLADLHADMRADLKAPTQRA